MSEIVHSKAKIYYSMGEVAEMFDVKPSLLRFWEQKFDILKPHKNKKGNRMFTPEDVDNLKIIYHLVREKGMTLAGAQKRIKDNREGVQRNMEIVERLLNVRSILLEIRQELKDSGTDSDDDQIIFDSMSMSSNVTEQDAVHYGAVEYKEVETGTVSTLKTEFDDQAQCEGEYDHLPEDYDSQQHEQYLAQQEAANDMFNHLSLQDEQPSADAEFVEPNMAVAELFESTTYANLQDESQEEMQEESQEEMQEESQEETQEESQEETQEEMQEESQEESQEEMQDESQPMKPLPRIIEQTLF